MPKENHAYKKLFEAAVTAGKPELIPVINKALAIRKHLAAKPKYKELMVDTSILLTDVCSVVFKDIDMIDWNEDDFRELCGLEPEEKPQE